MKRRTTAALAKLFETSPNQITSWGRYGFPRPIATKSAGNGGRKTNVYDLDAVMAWMIETRRWDAERNCRSLYRCPKPMLEETALWAKKMGYRV